ncbi:hypothetical protein ACS5PU_12970 [Pedobacter sp. GSP4]|uniref:hypothetical protein n=1 Tax=Pedobacter sp. GSP4 TaxID=3453716 RepID=UPI003EEB4092
MIKNYKILFIPALLFISVLNPACKHGTDNAMELYRRYAIKNLVIHKTQKVLHHD